MYCFGCLNCYFVLPVNHPSPVLQCLVAKNLYVNLTKYVHIIVNCLRFMLTSTFCNFPCFSFLVCPIADHFSCQGRAYCSLRLV